MLEGQRMAEPVPPKTWQRVTLGRNHVNAVGIRAGRKPPMRR
jgi:hypothetical protein